MLETGPHLDQDRSRGRERFADDRVTSPGSFTTSPRAPNATAIALKSGLASPVPFTRLGQRFLLVWADGGVALIVGDEEPDRDVVLDRRRQLGAGHQHPAVPEQRHDLASGMTAGQPVRPVSLASPTAIKPAPPS